MHGYKKFYLMHHYYRKQYRTLYIYRTLAMDIVTWVGLMCVKLRQDYWDLPRSWVWRHTKYMAKETQWKITWYVLSQIWWDVLDFTYFYFTIHSPAKKMPSSTEFVLSLLTVTSIVIQYYTSTLLDLKFLNKLIKCAIILLKPILCAKHLW